MEIIEDLDISNIEEIWAGIDIFIYLVKGDLTRKRLNEILPHIKKWGIRKLYLCTFLS